VVKLHAAATSSKHLRFLSSSSSFASSGQVIKVGVDFLKTVFLNKFVYRALEGRDAVGNSTSTEVDALTTRPRAGPVMTENGAFKLRSDIHTPTATSCRGSIQRFTIEKSREATTHKSPQLFLHELKQVLYWSNSLASSTETFLSSRCYKPIPWFNVFPFTCLQTEESN